MNTAKTVLKSIVFFISCVPTLYAEKKTNILEEYLELGKPIQAQVITIKTPQGYEQFVQRLSQTASKNPEWFKKHLLETSQDTPFPAYDKKLSMTEEEYLEYKELWARREWKEIARVMVSLININDENWKLRATGRAMSLSLLRYNTEKNAFYSPNGALRKVERIQASEESLLGEWEGQEWRLEKSSARSTIRESIVIGKGANGKNGYIIYLLQERSKKAGHILVNKRLIVRFSLNSNV